MEEAENDPISKRGERGDVPSRRTGKTERRRKLLAMSKKERKEHRKKWKAALPKKRPSVPKAAPATKTEKAAKKA